MKSLIQLAAVAVCLLFATVATAGTVYLPVAVNQTIEGRQYRSVVWITNSGQSAARVDARFIASQTDGTVGLEDEVVDESVVVPPGGTVPVGAGLDKIGMLELTTKSDNMFYVGELNSFSAGGQKLATTSIPLIDSANLLSAGGTAHLLALERSVAATQTNLGVVNLGGEETECAIRAYRADSSQIQSTVRIPVAPLSHREFPAAFAILGEPSLDGARFEVTCDDPFYAYATILSSIPDYSQFVAPASGGHNALIDPGASGQLQRISGQFFRSTKTQGNLAIQLNVPAGVNYDSMTVEFDMFTDRFPTPLFTATAQMRRKSAGGLFWAHTIRGGGRNKSIIDMGVGDGLVHQGSNNAWAERSNYKVRVHYDTVAGRITFQTFRGSQLVESLGGSIGRFDLRHDGEGMEMIFGLSKPFDNAFFPPYNFRFSNLLVTGVASIN